MRTAIADFSHHPQPEFRTFGLLDPDAQHLAIITAANADGEVLTCTRCSMRQQSPIIESLVVKLSVTAITQRDPLMLSKDLRISMLTDPFRKEVVLRRWSNRVEE